MSEEDLWSTADSMRREPNYVPKVAERWELLEHIAKLQAQMDAGIAQYGIKERDTLRRKVVALTRRNGELMREVKALRIQVRA